MTEQLTPPSVAWVAREALVGEAAPPPVLLLGEANPYGADPSFALYCRPVGCSGFRLRRAKQRAAELLVPCAPYPVIVMLGRKVTEAMRRVAMLDSDLAPFSVHGCCPGFTLVSLPHPSGRNAARWSGAARAHARQILAALVPSLPWGSADAEDQAS